ncbi:MAG: Na(+)/H(+) antiporter subunit C [Clostridia bacterium]|nr:Na(+)/H(+) antiporter subunit C [Clostridia bacterium]
MELLISLLVGFLFASAVYLMLSRNILRIIVGTGLISHAAHLLLMTMGGLKRGATPFLGQGATAYTDPLPHALILTSIVIGFGVTAFLLVLAYRAYNELGSADINDYRGLAEDE